MLRLFSCWAARPSVARGTAVLSSNSHRYSPKGFLLRGYSSKGFLGYKSPSHLVRCARKAIETSQELQQLLLASNDASKSLRYTDDISNALCLVADAASAIQNVNVGADWDAACSTALLDVELHMRALNVDQRIYDKLRSFSQRGQLSPTEEDVLGLFLKDFEDSLVHLPLQQRQTMQALLARESDACQSYLDADQRANAQQLQLKNTKSNSPFLPAKLLSVQHAASPQRVSSNFSEVVALLQQTECAETRAEIWAVTHDAYVKAVFPSLKELISVRRDIAQAAGWQSYAHHKLLRTALPNPDLVRDFLEHVHHAVAPLDEADAVEVISKWPSKLNGSPVDPATFAVRACDTHWLLGRHKAVAAGLGGAEMAEYFPVHYAVRAAVQLVASWCGAWAAPVDNKSVWSSDVSVFHVSDSPGEIHSPGGFVYIDVGRRNLRTCCSAVQAGICDEEFSRRQPAIAVVSVSTRGSPAGCIAPHSLANLFHELGHAFHHIMGCTAFQSNSALRSSPELFEIPSQMMEMMMWQPEVLRSLALNGIPARVCDAIARQASVLGSSETMRSLALSAVDLDLHSSCPIADMSGFDDVAAAACSSYGSRLGGPHHSDRRWWVSHTHMTGYAAMYWSYTWSRAVASGAAVAYKSDAAQCRRILQQIFKKGAIAQPADYRSLADVDVASLASVYAAMMK